MGCRGCSQGRWPQGWVSAPGVRPGLFWAPHVNAHVPGHHGWRLHNHLYMLIGMEKHGFSPLPGAGCWALVGKEMFGV